jgi:hypothetical protein
MIVERSRPFGGIGKNINTSERITFAFVFVLVIIGVVLSYVDLHLLMTTYAGEDGLIEWLTVIALTIGMCVCFWRVFTLRSSKPITFLIMTLMLGLIFLFGAGEEISWGQRVFNIESPDWFLTHNNRGETNLHNLVVMGVDLNKLIFGKVLGVIIILYVFVLPPLYRRKETFARFVDSLAIPVAQLHHAIGFILLWFIVYVLSASAWKVPELIEFGGAFLFLVIVAFPYNAGCFGVQSVRGRGERTDLDFQEAQAPLCAVQEAECPAVGRQRG